MPRVLRIINRLNLGGPTYNAAFLTRYLEPDFETMLVAGIKEDSEASSQYILSDMGIEPVRINSMKRPIHPLRDHKAFREIDQIIKDFKPDIVHTHAAKAGALGRLAAKRNNVPVVLHTFHGHVFHSYFNPVKTRTFLSIERYLAKLSTRIIAISDRQQRELTETHGVCDRSKVSVVPLGFDLDRFGIDQPEKRLKLRKAFRLQDDEIAIGIVGRLVPVKNHAMFLEAIERVVHNTQKKVRFFIVGDGEMMESLQALAHKLQLEYTVGNPPDESRLITFTSWMKNVDEVNAAMDIMALTSLNEGTPVSLIEAQAAGKPIVSTQVGGIEDFIKHGETGLLSPSGDLRGFTENLSSLIENDALRQQFAACSANSVTQQFSYQRLVSDMRSLYHQLLQERVPALSMANH